MQRVPPWPRGSSLLCRGVADIASAASLCDLCAKQRLVYQSLKGKKSIPTWRCGRRIWHIKALAVESMSVWQHQKRSRRNVTPNVIHLNLFLLLSNTASENLWASLHLAYKSFSLPEAVILFDTTIHLFRISCVNWYYCRSWSLFSPHYETSCIQLKMCSHLFSPSHLSLLLSPH